VLSPYCRIVYPLGQRSRDRGETVPKGTNSVRNLRRVVLWLVLLLPISAFAQTNQTVFSNTTSSSVGATNAVFTGVTTYVGPQTIFVGARGVCTLQPPPYPNCTLTGGTGTAADPLLYNCPGAGSIPTSGCAAGTPFTLAGGQVDIDLYQHTETAGAAGGGAVATPVPLDPWVPIGSALGVALLAIGWQLRGRRS
jgi:hypothetical protein